MEKSFKARGMTVIKEFKKAKRPDFIKEYVQYGEQDTFYLFKIENKSP
jgi:hypothetical protein